MVLNLLVSTMVPNTSAPRYTHCPCGTSSSSASTTQMVAVIVPSIDAIMSCLLMVLILWLIRVRLTRFGLLPDDAANIYRAEKLYCVVIPIFFGF